MLKRSFLYLATLASVSLAIAATSQAAEPAQPQGSQMLPTPSKSGYAPVNGVEVYYAVYGTGKPLILLHGGVGAIEMFGPVLTELAKTHQVIGVDLQAHGRTLPFDRPMSFEAMAGDVAGLVKFLGYDKADIMGYSMGGSVALRTAIDHPEVVDRLVLVSTPYAFAGWHDYNREGMKQMSGRLAEPMKQTPMYQLYTQIAPDPNNWPKLLEQLGSMIGKDYDWSAAIASIKSPTLLVVGDYDAVRIQHATKFFELLGGGHKDGMWDGSGMTPNRFAVVPSATHYTLFADPRLAEVAIHFLDAAKLVAQ
ncbi:MAG TPA: alpha/beta hydrolase [Arsenicitalea sp.]|jgi:pimeloyl-ACP methyl ester carboxylesterase|nr:alpha/beta hydrolase [Arsenicitalea sp.]